MKFSRPSRRLIPFTHGNTEVNGGSSRSVILVVDGGRSGSGDVDHGCDLVLLKNLGAIQSPVSDSVSRAKDS